MKKLLLVGVLTIINLFIFSSEILAAPLNLAVTPESGVGPTYVSITWNAEQSSNGAAVTCDLSVDGVAVGGNPRPRTGGLQQTYEKTTEVGLVCYANGQLVGRESKTVNITYVPKPEIVSFTATPAVLSSQGGPVTLSWTVKDATSCYGITNTFSSPWKNSKPTASGGTQQLTVSETTTFTLSCTNDNLAPTVEGRTVGKNIQVLLEHPKDPQKPSIYFFASPNNLEAGGGSVNLTWEIINATASPLACEALDWEHNGSKMLDISVVTDDGTGPKAKGSSVQQVTSSRTFTIACSNKAGFINKTVSVQVAGPCVPGNSCAANTCVGSGCTDACTGQFQAGTKACGGGSTCTPVNVCASLTCTGQTCSDGCGGQVPGTKACSGQNPGPPSNPGPGTGSNAGASCAGGNGTCSTIANCTGFTPISDPVACSSGLICCPDGGPGVGGNGGTNTSTGSLNCTGNYQKVAGVCFPKGTGLSEKSVLEIIAALISWLLAIFGFIALLGFIISGIQYLLSTGDEGMAETAKRNMKYSIVGIIVALSGWIIIKAVDALLNASSLI